MNDICTGCGKPIIPNVEARYTAREFRDPPEYWHYDCWQKKIDEEDAEMRSHGPLGEQFADTLAKMAWIKPTRFKGNGNTRMSITARVCYYCGKPRGCHPLTIFDIKRKPKAIYAHLRCYLRNKR